MTGRNGGIRSLVFPPLGLTAKQLGVRASGAQAPPGSPCNTLVVYMNLVRDARLIQTLLKGLGADEQGLHGDLQVMLSALRRMQAGVELMLGVEEGDTPGKASPSGVCEETKARQGSGKGQRNHFARREDYAMRTSDRQRAQQRKTHQHAETDEQYQERIRRDLELATGLKVEIARAQPGKQYIVKGYTPRGERFEEPLIRVVKPTLAAAASAFDYAAERLRSAGAKP